jgi:hypothetical protein
LAPGAGARPVATRRNPIYQSVQRRLRHGISRLKQTVSLQFDFTTTFQIADTWLLDAALLTRKRHVTALVPITGHFAFRLPFVPLATVLRHFVLQEPLCDEEAHFSSKTGKGRA